MHEQANKSLFTLSISNTHSVSVALTTGFPQQLLKEYKKPLLLQQDADTVLCGYQKGSLFCPPVILMLPLLQLTYLNVFILCDNLKELSCVLEAILFASKTSEHF